VVAGSAGKDVRLIESHLNYVAGIEAGRTIASSDTAGHAFGIVATNDWLAAGIRVGQIQAGQNLAKIPLVSFDGLPVASEPSFAIKSLSIPIDEIAKDAVTEIRRLHDSPSASGRKLLYSLILN
jgi:DNA-binding LacI/PurR family transcriptional regulator